MGVGDKKTCERLAITFKELRVACCRYQSGVEDVAATAMPQRVRGGFGQSGDKSDRTIVSRHNKAGASKPPAVTVSYPSQ